MQPIRSGQRMIHGWLWPLMAMLAIAGPSATGRAGEGSQGRSSWNWATASPESQGISTARLESAWDELERRHTTALLVIRRDRIVFERYGPGHGRSKPHYTASMA